MDACRNCGERALIKAHILPAAFGRMARGSGKDLYQISEAGRATTKNGPWDDKILCAVCDGKLGVLDKYASEFFRANSKQDFEPDEVYCIEEVKTGEIIRFAIAVLWRASISKKSWFEGVALGPYEEKFQKILFNEAALLSEINVLLLRYASKKFPMQNLMEFPQRMRVDGNNFYSFQMAGFRVLVKVGGKLATEAMKHFYLKANESRALVGVLDFDTSDELQGLLDVFSRSKVGRRHR
ncbi:hypothetical protein [Ferrovibrio sp.]|uniref:hypothetical protein n=1 Tax=Ferrovibrio sp. TaxID=1917215 RepID=UPI001B778DF7|nr:hypothetical protein [Ferrovibrio sp.]MBP7066363.1 hypothetical protein [Ferrovibrio sp.]